MSQNEHFSSVTDNTVIHFRVRVRVGIKKGTEQKKT